MVPVIGKSLPSGRHGSIQRTLSSSKSSALALSRLASPDPFKKTISSSNFGMLEFPDQSAHGEYLAMKPVALQEV